jgi:membrane protease YdiL (CAAX protease family)
MSAELIIFFILAYALSWCAFIPLALQANGLLSGIPAWLHIAGAFGPAVAALSVTAVTRRRAGLGELLGRMARWRIGWAWMGVALLSPLAVFLVVAVTLSLATGEWESFRQYGSVAELPGVRGFAGWLIWILTFGLGEETGWRGFALPRLQKTWSARSASLILGGLWAAWHIPTFFYNYELSLLSIFSFTIGILSGSALLTWLYNSTGGSLLACILWHGSYNAAVAGAGGAVAVIETAAVIIAVIVIANRYGPETLSRKEKQII